MKTRFTMAACLCAAAFAVAGALSLTGCVKEDAGMCGSDGGSAAPDGAVTVGWQAGRLTVAGASDDNGWNAMGAKGVSSLSRSAGASTRSGLPPAGMVDGAFQIGDLWVDGNRGKGVEKEMTWPEATQYCADLGLRLPTYDEMQQIIQYVRANSPLPDNRKFEFWNFTWEEPSYRYWTSTPRVDNPDYIWHGLIDYAHNLWNMDGWSADDGEELSARCVNRDEGGLPPGPDPGPDVDNPDGLPVGTTFRVVVYEAGADPQSASPVDQNTYKIADADGTIVAAAVDERGNATADAARELVLRRGAYDFYYFSPAVSANTALPNPGTYTGLANGADYMALAHRETIDPSKGSKHYIPEVCFYRMGSYIDVRIRPRAGEVVRTLEVTGDGLQLWGLPASGRYEIGDYPYRLITEGRGGMVEFAASDFAAEEGTTATASTLGVGGGRAVLPGYAGELQVKVTLTSDGKEMKLDASLAGHNFAPGYRYVVELGVGRIADNPELDIEILPWNEYDWGDGGIGGGGYLPIDTGGSTLLEPELEELGTWQQAVDYCRGKGDNWRLPTANELYYYWCVEP
ncbi:BF2992 family fimbrillin-A clan protein, partial [Alistipes finegoldii]|uniref:BF2992 family fimbrillin-A clan protein n=1 Tax=Alistipes finegoldii TaxID=214856 RepID=UPI0025A3073F